ncbi:alpha/beta hydrolase [Gemmatimonadota bacterium]
MLLSPSLAESLLFQPSRGDPGPPPQLRGVGGRSLTLTTDDGVGIQAWWYDLGDGPSVLFLHGNAGDISHRTPIAEGLLDEGMSVLLLEYRGYGGSQGKPSEDGVHIDALAGYDFLVEAGGDSRPIVVFGRSMGGAVAARLAARRPTGALVLESSFTSLEAMGRVLYPFLPGFLFRRLRGHFDTLASVRVVDAPLLVVHGTADEIIPLRMGLELLGGGNQPKEWLGVDGAGHNDVYWVGGGDYFRRIGDFIRRYVKGGPLD